MYSGRLEFRPELHQRLYNTAKILNMHILTKLLDTHAGSNYSGKPGMVKKLSSPLGTPPFSTMPVLNSRNSRPDNDGSDFIPGKK